MKRLIFIKNIKKIVYRLSRNKNTTSSKAHTRFGKNNFRVKGEQKNGIFIVSKNNY